MKKLKIKIKGFLVLKIVKYRKEIKAYKKRIQEDILKEQEFDDKITLLENEIRQLILKLPKEQQELYLRSKNKKGVRK